MPGHHYLTLCGPRLVSRGLALFDEEMSGYNNSICLNHFSAPLERNTATLVSHSIQ